MNEHLIPMIDEFLNEYLWGQKSFADDDTFEQATEDERGGGDFLPLSYYRTIVDPTDAGRLLVSFKYGTNTIEHEQLAPARAKQCMDALYAAHPEVAPVPVRLSVRGF